MSDDGDDDISVTEGKPNDKDDEDTPPPPP